MLNDLAAEVEVSTTRARGASRKRISAGDVEATSKKSKPKTRSQVKRSKKGVKKATPEAAIGDNAENIQPNLPTEVALPALDSKAPAKRTRKALTKGAKKSVHDSILGTRKDLVPFVLLEVNEELHIHTYQERAEFWEQLKESDVVVTL